MMRKVLTVGVLALVVMLVGVPTVAADAFYCDDWVGDVPGNVIVPAGAWCFLDGEVQGNVKVEPGGGLTVLFATVRGNIMAEDPVGVYLIMSSVEGNIHIRGAGETSTDGGHFMGNLMIQDSTGVLHIVAITVDGNVILRNNQDIVPVSWIPEPPPGRLVHVAHNSIGRNLICEGNDPTLDGADNTIGGKVMGQCSAFDQ